MKTALDSMKNCLTIFILLNYLSCLLMKSHSDRFWTYIGLAGPSFWCTGNVNCCKKNQSPIDFKNHTSTMQKRMIFVGYTAVAQIMSMSNNGHTVVIRLSSDIVPRISGGGLNGTYFLDNFHFHWGSKDSQGSEHQLEDIRYPLELHLVHYNSLFENLAEAISSEQPNALAVLGVLFKIGNKNSEIKSITDKLKYISYKGGSTTITPFALHLLIPSNIHTYFQYSGSLTTPTCDEVVYWTVFSAVNELSNDQIKRFREVFASAKDVSPPVKMSDNFRPLQSKNDRVVTKVLDVL